MAESQGIGSAALVESGIVHHVVPELPEDDPETLAIAVAATVAQHLSRLTRPSNRVVQIVSVANSPGEPFERLGLPGPAAQPRG